MKIEIDQGSGFCFGVTRAIGKAEEELATEEKLYCLGDIVHNGKECDRLQQLGLVTINHHQLHDIHDAKVLLRAHGEPPSTYALANERSINLIDATCPVVLHLQERIKKEYDADTQHKKQIVIFGKKGHAEVIGLEGQTNNTAIVIEKIADLNKIDFTRPIYLFSQTTKSVEEFDAIVEEIKKQSVNHFEYHNTICKNVANRVKRLQDFAKSNDVVIFVGGQKSSNAKVLYNNCLEVNSCTIFVSSITDITAEIMQQCHQAERVGICGATSTPKWLMEQVKQHIENNGI